MADGIQQLPRGYFGGRQVQTADVADLAITSGKLAAGAAAANLSSGSVTPSLIGLSVTNKTGSDIGAGKLVYVSGYDTGTSKPKIALADQSSSAALAVYCTSAAIANNASGTVYKQVTITGIDTSTVSAAGDPVYLGVSGGWTATAASAYDRQSQIVGACITKHASTGSVLIDLTAGQLIAIGNSQLLAAAVTGAKCSTVIATKSIHLALGTIATTGATIVTLPVAHAGTLAAVKFCAKDALAAHDSNYLTFAITNKGQSGAGSTAMLSATASGTTKATGGAAIAAYTTRDCPLHATGGNAALASGDCLELSVTATGTLANTVTEAAMRLDYLVTT